MISSHGLEHLTLLVHVEFVLWLHLLSLFEDGKCFLLHVHIVEYDSQVAEQSHRIWVDVNCSLELEFGCIKSLLLLANDTLTPQGSVMSLIQFQCFLITIIGFIKVLDFNIFMPH